MLVLTRKPGESIMIGNDIEVILLTNNPWINIRIGIEAPAHVNIARKELLQPKKLVMQLGGR